MESSIPKRPFVNRRSLALAPIPLLVPPVFPVYNLTRSPLTAALYYLNAWNRLGTILRVGKTRKTRKTKGDC